MTTLPPVGVGCQHQRTASPAAICGALIRCYFGRP